MDALASDIIELDRELIARGGTRTFMELAWPIVETARFKPNWHHDAICDHLDAVSRGDIRFLVITIPPGCTKSLSVSVFWPANEWTYAPDTKWIFASYGTRLSQRDAVRMRRLIDDPWFQQRWPKVSIPYQNTRSALDFANSMGGWRFSTTIKGGVTGRHADRIGVDDPIKPQDTQGTRAALATELDNVRVWYDQTLSTRQADPEKTSFTVIMQRLHELDLAGHCSSDPEYTHLRLPMEYEPKFHCSTRIGFNDPRKEDGELLWPERYPEAEVTRLKRKLGSQGAAAQLQQRPVPRGGKIFRQEWFRYWGVPSSPHPALPKRHRLIQAWDMTFKGAPAANKRRSFTVGQTWAAAGSMFFLVAQVRGQWEFVEALREFVKFSKEWPVAIPRLVEDAANGPAIESALTGKITGIRMVSASGGSEARANAIAPLFAAGNVWLPHPSIAPWVSEVYEGELTAFPMGANDDQVDATSHALVYLNKRASGLYASAMNNLEM